MTKAAGGVLGYDSILHATPALSCSYRTKRLSAKYNLIRQNESMAPGAVLFWCFILQSL
jgi:hypothetical protein